MNDESDIRQTVGSWGERLGAAARSVTSALRPAERASKPREDRTDLAPGDRRQRAERMVNDFSSWTRHYGSVAGAQVMRVAARAREEAEDIWAEAQALRDRAEEDKTPSPSPNDSAPSSRQSPASDRSRINDDVFTGNGTTG